MKKIDSWLNMFFKYWEKYQIESLMTLFTDEVEYREDPFTKIKNKILLEKEWQIIKNHKDIKIEHIIFSEIDQKYTIIFDREFKDIDGNLNQYRGVYLIRLNIEGKCDYFLQCREINKI